MIKVPVCCQHFAQAYNHAPTFFLLRGASASGQRTVHLGGHDGTGEDTATDGDHAGERALLVDVGAVNSGLGGAETQTDILVPSPGAGVLAGAADLVVLEDVRLSQRISIRTRCVCVCRGRSVVPASGKRAPTGHCGIVSNCSQRPCLRVRRT